MPFRERYKIFSVEDGNCKEFRLDWRKGWLRRKYVLILITLGDIDGGFWAISGFWDSWGCYINYSAGWWKQSEPPLVQKPSKFFLKNWV